MPRFILVEVSESANCPMTMARSFSTLGDVCLISQAKVLGPDGRVELHHVTGWSPQGPTPAYAVLVEDSGAT